MCSLFVVQHTLYIFGSGTGDAPLDLDRIIFGGENGSD